MNNSLIIRKNSHATEMYPVITEELHFFKLFMTASCIFYLGPETTDSIQAIANQLIATQVIATQLIAVSN
jgi:hypothetical protein